MSRSTNTNIMTIINRNRNKNRNSIFILDNKRQHHNQQTDRRYHHRTRIHSDPIHHGTQFLIQHKTKTHATFLACISNSNRRMILLNVNVDVDAYLNVDVDAAMELQIMNDVSSGVWRVVCTPLAVCPTYCRY